MKTHNKILSCLAIALITAGCSAQMSFEELTKDELSELDVRTFSSSKMNYSISLLKSFDLIDKDYSDTLKVEMFVDTTAVFEEGTRTLTVIEFNSSETTLEGAWRTFVANRILIEDFRIYSEGSTDYLSRPSYYEHSACTISKKNTETISFLFHGEDSSFYLVSLQVITEGGYPDNMKELLYCAKSMKTPF